MIDQGQLARIIVTAAGFVFSFHGPSEAMQFEFAW